MQGETIDAQFLNVIRRSGPSQYYDYFYSCNSCGRGVQWEVDGESAATHTITDNIGSVAYETERNDSSVLRYTSVLLRKQPKNEAICMDVLLIVTRTEMHPIQVICRGASKQVVIDHQLPDLTVDRPVTENDVKLNFIIGQRGVVLSNSSFVTQVIMCTTSETSQLWERDQKLAGAFNRVDSAGSSYSESHDLDSSVVSREAILLVKRRNVELTSVLIISELNSTLNYTVSCLSDTSFASISLPQGSNHSNSTHPNSTRPVSDRNISTTVSTSNNSLPPIISQAQSLQCHGVSEV